MRSSARLLYHVKKAGTVEVGDVGGDAEPSHIGNEPFAERFKPFFDVVLAPEGYLVFVVPCQGYQLYTVFKSLGVDAVTRFDVCEVYLEDDMSLSRINYIENAF